MATPTGSETLGPDDYGRPRYKEEAFPMPQQYNETNAPEDHEHQIFRELIIKGGDPLRYIAFLVDIMRYGDMMQLSKEIIEGNAAFGQVADGHRAVADALHAWAQKKLGQNVPG